MADVTRRDGQLQKLGAQTRSARRSRASVRARVSVPLTTKSSGSAAAGFRFHGGAEKLVDAGLVAAALGSEPSEDVGVGHVVPARAQEPIQPRDARLGLVTCLQGSARIPPRGTKADLCGVRPPTFRSGLNSGAPTALWRRGRRRRGGWRGISIGRERVMTTGRREFRRKVDSAFMRSSCPALPGGANVWRTYGAPEISWRTQAGRWGRAQT